MAQQFDPVLRGDLITADLMNKILSELESLGSRVTVLETATAPSKVVITGLIPASGPLRIRQELRVLGQNFGFIGGTGRVLIDDVLVTALKPGSSDQLLIFDIPDVPNVPLTGRSAVLTVANQNTTDQRTITLLPAQPLQGAIDVIWLNVTPTTLTPNNPATFRFRLKSRTNLDATYTINPVITVATNAQDWQNRLQVLDNAQNVLPSRTISLAAGQEMIFHVRINPVPANTNGVPFTLTANAIAEGVTGNSGPTFVTVGTAVEQPDTSVSLAFEAAQFDPVGLGVFVSDPTEDIIQLKANGAAEITLLAEFTAIGTYEPSVVLVPGTTGWNAIPHPQKTPQNYQVSEAQLQNPQGKHDEAPAFIITPQAGASATGEVEFRIRNQSAGTRRTLRMRLALIL